MGLVEAPAEGETLVRIWQANIGKRIHARVFMAGGEVVEEGSFELDGVAFPAAEIPLEILDPVSDTEDGGGAMFPTRRCIETLDVPDVGLIEVSLINAGIPTVFVDAGSLGLSGTDFSPR
jgi:2-methylaconitate cis-trans-isomerase PrpF